MKTNDEVDIDIDKVLDDLVSNTTGYKRYQDNKGFMHHRNLAKVELLQLKDKWERAALEALNEKIVPLDQSEVETVQRITKLIDQSISKEGE